MTRHLTATAQALVFAGSMTFNPATDSLTDKNGKPFKFKAPYGNALAYANYAAATPPVRRQPSTCRRRAAQAWLRRREEHILRTPRRPLQVQGGRLPHQQQAPGVMPLLCIALEYRPRLWRSPWSQACSCSSPSPNGTAKTSLALPFSSKCGLQTRWQRRNTKPLTLFRPRASALLITSAWQGHG